MEKDNELLNQLQDRLWDRRFEKLNGPPMWNRRFESEGCEENKLNNTVGCHNCRYVQGRQLGFYNGRMK